MYICICIYELLYVHTHWSFGICNFLSSGRKEENATGGQVDEPRCWAFGMRRFVANINSTYLFACAKLESWICRCIGLHNSILVTYVVLYIYIYTGRFSYSTQSIYDNPTTWEHRTTTIWEPHLGFGILQTSKWELPCMPRISSHDL